MRRLVPDFVLNRYARGEVAGEITATVLFVDVVGFSLITQRLAEHGRHGAEVVANLMRGVFEPLIHAAHHHGGFIVGFAGDALTAVFPHDADLPQAARHAIAASREMQPIAPDAGETPYGEFPIYVRIGAATGQLTWGVTESEDGTRATYFVHGPAIDEAAVAQQSTAAGTTALTSALAADLGAAVTIESDGDHARLLAMVDPPAPVSITSPPPNADDLIARFVPAEALARLDTPEFRPVVNVFINVPTDRTDAELAALMRAVFRLEDRYGGLLTRLDFGDKGAVLSLFWGAPVTHENDVHAALDFLVDLRALADVPIDVGVTHGTAHAGFIGSDERDEYTCYGPATNLAARMMTAAPQGEIWVDAAVARQAESRFGVVPVGELTFKGIDTPQPVFRLGRRSALAEVTFAGQMVGRRDELDRLTSLVTPILSGHFAGTVLVHGEPGIGKSRLVHELALELDRIAPCSVFWLQTNETVRDPGNPVAYWLTRYFGQNEYADREHNEQAFTTVLDDLVAATDDAALTGELERTRSFLGGLVRLRWPESLFEQVSAEARRENSFMAVTALLQAEARRRPVLLCLEDVQWLDADSRTFLPQLVRTMALADTAVAIVATTRPGPEASLGVEAETISLEELTDTEVATLAAEQLGGPPTPALVALIQERAEGNPFFTTELLRYLSDEGLVRHTGDGWGLSSSVDAAVVPADVRTVLVSRLDGLDRNVTDVVQAAAVLGREFDDAEVAAMLERDSVEDELLAAEELGMCVLLGAGRCGFRHALLRDAAYEMQTVARRTEMHRRAVAALEAVHAGGTMPYAALGLHAEAAGMLDDARRYLRLAGEDAAARFSNDQAATHFSKALLLTPDDVLDERLELLLGREAAAHHLGWREMQAADLDALDALTATRDRDIRADVALRRFEYARAINATEEAFAAAERALAAAEEGGDPSRRALAHVAVGRMQWLNRDLDGTERHLATAIELARAYDLPAIESEAVVMLGIIDAEQDRYGDARRRYERGLERARVANDAVGEAWAINSLGVLSIKLDDYAAARGYLEAALEIRRRIGYRLGEAGALTNLAMVAEMEGDYEEALHQQEASLAIAREIGDSYNEGWARNNLGLTLAMLGRFDDAAEQYEAALEAGREAGEVLVAGNVFANQALMEHQRGDQKAAIDCAGRAIAIAEQANAQELLAESLTDEGHALAATGDLDGAEASYRRALQIRRDVGQETKAVETIAGLARVALARGDATGARRTIDSILPVVEAGDLAGTFEPFRVYLTCIEVLAAIGDARADALRDQAAAVLRERAGRIDDPELRRSFVDDVWAHRELLHGDA